MHRTDAERNTKWSPLVEVTHGQLYVVVLGSRQQPALMTELSERIQATHAKKVSLAVSQYLKAVKPETSSVSTYTTT